MTKTEKITIPAGPNCYGEDGKACDHLGEDNWDCHYENFCALAGKLPVVFGNEEQMMWYLGKWQHLPDNSKSWLPKCAECTKNFPNGGTYTVTTTIDIAKENA